MAKTEIIKFVLYAIPLAMGVAITVLSILGESSKEAHGLLLGIAVLCLALAGLRTVNVKKL